jgi:hypothetical protein
MRYPNFAAALRSHGRTVAEIQERLGFKSYSQTIQYLAGRTLPRAEKILPFPDLVEAARQDVMERRQPEQLAA